MTKRSPSRDRTNLSSAASSMRAPPNGRDVAASSTAPARVPLSCAARFPGSEPPARSPKTKTAAAREWSHRRIESPFLQEVARGSRTARMRPVPRAKLMRRTPLKRRCTEGRSQFVAYAADDDVGAGKRRVRPVVRGGQQCGRRIGEQAEHVPVGRIADDDGGCVGLWVQGGDSAGSFERDAFDGSGPSPGRGNGEDERRRTIQVRGLGHVKADREQRHSDCAGRRQCGRSTRLRVPIGPGDRSVARLATPSLDSGVATDPPAGRISSRRQRWS